jgi:hypothetical protein
MNRMPPRHDVIHPTPASFLIRSHLARCTEQRSNHELNTSEAGDEGAAEHRRCLLMAGNSKTALHATHPGLQDIDPWTALFWAPRTVSVLACGARSPNKRSLAQPLRGCAPACCTRLVRAEPPTLHVRRGGACLLQRLAVGRRRAASGGRQHAKGRLCSRHAVSGSVAALRAPRRRELTRTRGCLSRPAGYSTAHGPESVLLRPHPAVWRLMHGVSVVYLTFLAFTLLQTPRGARQLMTVRAGAAFGLSSEATNACLC